MFWFLNSEQLKQLEEDFALLVAPSKERVKAKRFEFVFNNSYYVLNAKVNYNDCGMVGRSRYSHGRVISERAILPNPGVENEDEEGPMKISDIPLSQQKSKYYFQYRLDRIPKEFSGRPRVCIGVCRDDFLINQDLSRQKYVWCVNLETGDKFTNKRWKNYYCTDPKDKINPPRFGLFRQGCVIGVLVDMDRGTLNFFKDGIDLGPAFIDRKLRSKPLFPFVQVQCKVEMHIFHPASHPLYRAPASEESVARWEEEERHREAEEKVREEKRRRRLRRRLLGLDPDGSSDDDFIKDVMVDEVDPKNWLKRRRREKKEIARIRKKKKRERKLAAMAPEKREAVEKAKAKKE